MLVSPSETVVDLHEHELEVPTPGATASSASTLHEGLEGHRATGSLKGKDAEYSEKGVTVAPGEGVGEKQQRIPSASPYEGQGTESDPFVVRWLDADAAEGAGGGDGNPLLFPSRKKWYIVGCVAGSTMCVAFGSSVFAGGQTQMVEYFHKSNELLTSGLSFYVLGFALGPLLWGPLSEVFGRRPVCLATYSLYTLFILPSALAKNLETLLISRFLAGLFGGAQMSNSGAVVADVFTASDRALGMSLYAMCPFLGPVIGPILGGYIGEYTTWRWVFWAQLIFAGVTLFFHIFVPETYAAVLLKQRAARLTNETGYIHISIYDLTAHQAGAKPPTLLQKLKTDLGRPVQMLFTEPIVALFALYCAVIYGILYSCFGGLALVFQKGRHWKGGAAGLAFIGIGVGATFGIYANFIINKSYVRKLAKNGGQPLPPEDRLPLCIIGGVAVPIGLFWLAWTQQPSVHWILPIIGSAPFGFGMVCIFLAVSNYLVDAYLLYAASTLAANTLFRSLFGAAFPLFITPMFTRLGNSWALSLFAFLSLGLVPIPLVFMRYGASLRGHSKFAPGHPASHLSRVPTLAEVEVAAEVAEADLARSEDERAERALAKVV
ncbi:MFS general substrate transporter [Meredithblackwellia eburnea MCA 4105]